MRALAATFRSALVEAWSNRASFWAQVTAMILNDAAWVAFWLLFFDRVGSMRGWDASSVLLLQAALTATGGIVLGIFANARRVGRMAADGQLDAVLALPVAPFGYLLVRRIETINLGDIMFGFTLFAVAGQPTLGRTVIFVGSVMVAVVAFTGFLITIGSLAFFAGRGEAGDLGTQSMLLLAAYPVDIFSGPARTLLYTAIPAALVAAVPARLVDSFDPTKAAILVVVAAVFATSGWVMFTLGLRRYTSGSVWTRA